MSREHATNIPFLLFVGGGLYGLLGLSTYFVIGGAFQDYAGFVFFPALSWFLSFVLRLRSWPVNLPSWTFLVSNQLSLAYVYFCFPQGDERLQILASALMLVAVVDAAVLMTPAVQVASHWITAISTAMALYLQPQFFVLLVLGPVLLLLIWKVFLNWQLRLMLEKQIKARQFEAFRATVVTLNHEFNNVAAICDVVIAKIRTELAGEPQAKAEDLTMLERNLKRLVVLIKQLRGLKSYSEVVYQGDVKMVDLSSDPPKDLSSASGN